MLVEQSLPRARAGGRHRRLSTRMVMIAVIIACAAFLFLDDAPSRIMIWDESRLMVNALEMRLTGFSLVTTYGFAPDLWNTKPPLAIWAMLASINLFGPSEWALRLPSALAALGTLLLVFDFTYRVSRSQVTAAAAALLLAGSIGFFGDHGAHTADSPMHCSYFCVTGHLHRSFFAIHTVGDRGRELWIAAAALYRRTGDQRNYRADRRPRPAALSGDHRQTAPDADQSGGSARPARRLPAAGDLPVAARAGRAGLPRL